MKDYVVAVSKDCMLSIFAGNTLDELPYRFQPHVKFVIDFNEYSAFCRMVLDANIKCLVLDSKCHIKAFNEKDTELLKRLFYMDVSQAILVELLLAVNVGREASMIMHTFGDECGIRHLSLSDISTELKKLPENARTRALNDIQKLVPLPNMQLSKHNEDLLEYAYYLRSLSWMSNPEIINLE